MIKCANIRPRLSVMQDFPAYSSNKATHASIFIYLSNFDHFAVIGIRFGVAFGLNFGVISQRHVDNTAFSRLVWTDPFRFAPHFDLLGGVLCDQLQPFHLLLGDATVVFGRRMVRNTVAIDFDDNPRRVLLFGGFLAEDSIEDEFQSFKALPFPTNQTSSFA